jgi:lysozyme
MNISPTGIAFIEANEGFVAHEYNDNGKQAIGYGHDLLPGESYPEGITQEQAEALLFHDLVPVQTALASLVPPDCTQNQWDALCDFGYNLGVGALKTMLGHGWDQVPVQALRWNHINGTPAPGLTARRNAEVAIFVGTATERA